MESQFQFENLSYLHLIWPIIAIIVFVIFALINKKKWLLKLTSVNNFKDLVKTWSINRQISKISLKILAMIFIVLALMRPQGNPVKKEMKVKGRDIIFVLDVSKSMLAEDRDPITDNLLPDRLNRAKTAIRDVVDSLDGDRVALVVFAGGIALKSPLTNDYNFFKTVLNRVSPLDINKGGSLIGDAIRFVNKSLISGLDSKELRYQDIILITDGEDQESFPIEAAKQITEIDKENAGQANKTQNINSGRIRIHTVGIGSVEGTKILIKNQDGHVKEIVKTTKGSSTPHRTTLNENVLKEIARITGGIYVSAKTKSLHNFDRIYHEKIASHEVRELKAKEKIRWDELFQFFAAIAILFLTLSYFTPTRLRRNRNLNTLTMFFLLAACSLLCQNCSDSASTMVDQGNQLLINNNADKATEKYKQAKGLKKDSQAINYNLAQSDYLQGNYKEARERFTKLIDSQNELISKKALTGLANVMMKTADMLSEKSNMTAKSKASTVPVNPNQQGQNNQQGQMAQQAYQMYTESIKHYRKVIEAEKNLVKSVSEKPFTEAELVNISKKQSSIIQEAYNNLERAIIKRSKLELPKSKNKKNKQQKQDQQKQDQQKQDQQKQDQQKQDQQKQDQHKQDQQKQDQQKQAKDARQNKDQKTKDKKQGNKEDHQALTGQEARELLDKMRAENKDIKAKIRELRRRKQGKAYTVDRDW